MTTRRIGPLDVSPTGLGCMGLSQGYGPTSRDRGQAAIHAALDAGVTLFDTAMSYGQGDNERLLGEALQAAGEAGRQALVATKVGITRREDGVTLDADPERIRAYATASLERLGRDVIDLYYLHRVDPRFPIQEQVAALGALVKEGLVRAIGVSEVTPEQLRTAAASVDIAAVQLEWSLAWREPERDIIPAARELGVAVVPYSPLGRGLLTGSAESRTPENSPFRANDPRFDDTHHGANLAASAELAALAERLGITPSRLALAWLIRQGTDVVPIPGSRDPQRVRDNAAAADVDLDDAALGCLDEISARFVGDRHSFAVPSTTRTP